MSPDVSIGIDFVSPHDHSIPECRHPAPGKPRDPSTQATDAECAARSAIHHISRKHGVECVGFILTFTACTILVRHTASKNKRVFGII